MHWLNIAIDFILLILFIAIAIIFIGLFAFGGCYFVWEVIKNVSKTIKETWEEERK